MTQDARCGIMYVWQKAIGVRKMSVIMPTIEGYKIMTPDMKSVVSEHGPDELKTCRELIEGTSNIIHYIFKEIEENDTVH